MIKILKIILGILLILQIVPCVFILSSFMWDMNTGVTIPYIAGHIFNAIIILVYLLIILIQWCFDI